MNFFLRCVSAVRCVRCGYGVALLIDVTHLCSPLCISVSFTVWCWCSFAVYNRQMWFIVSNFNKSLKNGLAVIRTFGSHADFLHFSSFFLHVVTINAQNWPLVCVLQWCVPDTQMYLFKGGGRVILAMPASLSCRMGHSDLLAIYGIKNAYSL